MHITATDKVHREWLAFTVLKDASLHVDAVSASIAAEAHSNGRQMTAAHPNLPSMQGMLFTDPASGGAFLVSPNMVSFEGSAEPLRSSRPLLHASPAAHPSGLTSSGLLSASGLTFNGVSALTPTTRALFGHPAQKSPMYAAFNYAPITPSAMLFGHSALSLQRSPGMWGGFSHPDHHPIIGSVNVSSMPPQSPIKVSYERLDERT